MLSVICSVDDINIFCEITVNFHVSLPLDYETREKHSDEALESLSFYLTASFRILKKKTYIKVRPHTATLPPL